ncbi:unnamed protein product, partial [Ectocarpus fasciculatus]
MTPGSPSLLPRPPRFLSAKPVVATASATASGSARPCATLPSPPPCCCCCCCCCRCCCCCCCCCCCGLCSVRGDDRSSVLSSPRTLVVDFSAVRGPLSPSSSLSLSVSESEPDSESVGSSVPDHSP